MVQADDYEGREAAYVKHFVLEHYLEQLAFKVGRFRPGTTLNYIDGFSGPWQQATEQLRDTSPHIALTKLRAARVALGKQGIDLRVRGMFVEQDPEAHRLLEGLLAREFADIETMALSGRFEDSIGAAVHYGRGGANPFAFIFIDPTGWTGFGLESIRPLIRISPCEVMINFMTKDIVRFVDDEESTAVPSFVELFGDADYRTAWSGRAGLDREDAIVATYCGKLRDAGDFEHVGATIILNPQRDRTHYHLIYATRSLHGLIAFRDTERQAMSHQQHVRAEARQRRRIESRSQPELFTAATMETRYMDELRERYQLQAKGGVESLLRQRGRVGFDELVGHTLRSPLVCQKDLKDWLEAWRRRGAVSYVGLAPGQRAPRVKKGHAVEWRGP
jgi:three-Cys-motif partner protein